MIHKQIFPGPWTYNGNGIVRTLQYENSFPRMDIVIRESIQNSLDARKTEGSNLDMRFRFEEFDVKSLSDHLEGTESLFRDRFGPRSRFLEISDVGTVGLNGPLESIKRAEYGNLIKLVYSIGEKQQGSGKGGSWGYGKTCYYTLGVGIVAYYSRTIVDGDFQERLIVALIEDTDHKDSMLFPDYDLGVSYWGEVSKKSDLAIPVTDESTISAFLNIFGTNRYEENETGTKIIIPFVDEDDLCKEMMDAIDLKNRTPDKTLFDNLILLSVQRWYFPKIWNDHPDGDLRFFLNGKLLTEDDVTPLFKTLGKVFRNTFTENSTEILSRSDYLMESKVLAHYAFSEGKIADLQIPFDTKLSVFLYASNSSSLNLPVGFRCRSLGMINCYDCGKGIVENASPLPADRYRLVGVRPEADTPIFNTKTKQCIVRLEEYIRRGENPAHSTWEDLDLKEFDQSTNARPRLISKVIGDVSAFFSGESEDYKGHKSRNLGVGRAVGKRLLPDDGFGRYSSSRGRSAGKGDSGGGSGPRSGGLSTEYAVYNDKTTTSVECRAVFGKTAGPYTLELYPAVEGGFKTMANWMEKCDMDYPIEIQKFELTEIDNEVCDPPIEIRSDETKDIKGLSLGSMSVQGRMYALNIKKTEIISEIRLKITLHTGGSLFGMRIELKEVGHGR